MRPICLEFLTCIEASPPRLIDIAAANDVRLVNLLIGPAISRLPDWDMVGDTPVRRETIARCRDLGVEVDMAEPFSIHGETTARDVDAQRPVMETAAALQARCINVILRRSEKRSVRREDELERAGEPFLRYCELAAEYGIRVVTELSRRMMIRNLPEGLAFLDRVGRTDVQINIDTLHFFRFDGKVEQIAGASARISRIQLSDGPATMPGERQWEEAIGERMIPGEGEFPLRALVDALRPDAVIGLEVPLSRMRAQGISAEERARRVIAATRRLIG